MGGNEWRVNTKEKRKRKWDGREEVCEGTEGKEVIQKGERRKGKIKWKKREKKKRKEKMIKNKYEEKMKEMKEMKKNEINEEKMNN